MDLFGYDIHEQIYSGMQTDVFRATRHSDTQPVILKILKAIQPEPEQIIRLQHEFELIQALDASGVIGAYALHRQPQHCLVLEDLGATTLSQLQLAGRLSLRQFLGLAIHIVEAVGQIHQQRVIHKDINPTNVVMNPDTGQVKLIDFGIATLLPRETPAYRSPSQLEGTLPYIAPEQTGRMNRGIDRRTDFYSLGVTLYELLTGVRPFDSKDPLELVHAHIALQPRPPHELFRARIDKPDIPPILSAIILKLMAKTAEDRYQSAAGIRTDLAECLRHIDTLTTYNFPLAQRDTSDRFQIPQKLYGRARAIAELLAAFSRVADRVHDEGRSELALVTGTVGIGKSVLIPELYQPVTTQQGYFISGKFDQLQRSVPYSALLQAFRSLIQQILTEDEGRIAQWRQQLLTTLGVNAQVLVDVLPELELIIGSPPTVPELGLNESQNRFHLTLQRFVSIFAQPDHPLVLYLDDLQWADGASLRLMEQLLNTAKPPCLLLIGAYRDNEVGKSHLLTTMLGRLEQDAINVTPIHLEPLTLSQTCALVADTLYQPTDQVTELAAIVLEKTRGNPFFIGEFLQSLYTNGLIHFSSGSSGWQWDLTRIREQHVTTNVVGLLTERIDRLPQTTQAVLQLAACQGHQFTLANLATSYQNSRAKTAADLQPALLAGHVLPLNGHYQVSESTDTDLDGQLQASYRFAHDRVQQAVYAQIPNEERQATHQRIGLTLLAQLSEQEQEKQLFAIVGHLNRGLNVVSAPGERRQLAQLNLQAGVRAKQATAYDTALDYLQTGLDLLPVDSWQTDYNLTLALHTEAAEAAHLNREFERSDALADIILRFARLESHKVRAIEAKISTRKSQNAMVLALDVGVEAIERLGITLLQRPPQLPPLENLQHLPQMTDPEQLAAMHIMETMLTAALIAKPALLLQIVYTMVDLALRAGNSDNGALGYGAFGIILLATMDQIEQGYQLGRLSQTLLARDDAVALCYRADIIFYCNIGHWKEPAREVMGGTQQTIYRCLEIGAIETAALAAVEYCLNLILIGDPLESVHQEQSSLIALVETLQQEEAIFHASVSHQFVLNLCDAQLRDPHQVTGECFDATALLPRLQQANDRTTLFAVHVLNAWLCLLFKRPEEAVAHAQKAEQYAQSAIGLMVVGPYNFIYSLALLAAYPAVDETTQCSYLAKVTANQAKMALWAEHAPMNFQHRYDLVEAERLRVNEQLWAAATHYEQAIQGASLHGYLPDEALAHELAAAFFLTHRMETTGQPHLLAAHRTYNRWQAKAKVAELEAHYPQLLASTGTLPRTWGDQQKVATTLPTTATTPRSSTVTTSLDMTSILKASQMLSSEMNLRNLLTQLMAVVIENAGAETGYLLMEREGQWAVEASSYVDKEDVTVMQSIPTAQIPRIAQPIVNYVVRTQQSVILDDAATDPRFQRHSRNQARFSGSILALPLLNQSKLIAILYLENRLVTGAFTPERLDVLNLLSAQAAISIENALLYTKVQERETRYRYLVETMNDGLNVVDERGIITFVNDTFCRMLGYTADELVGLPLEHLFDQKNREILETQTTLRQSGQNASYEITYRRKNGLPLYAIVSPEPLFDEGRTFRGSVTVVTDITDRVLAQEVLERRVEERTNTLATLLETTRTVVSTLDLEPLLNLILDQLERVVAYTGSVIMELDEDALVVLAYRGPAAQQDALYQRYPAAMMLEGLTQIDPQQPLIVADVNHHAFVTTMLRQTLGSRMDFLLSYSRSWMAIPLIVGEQIIGLLSVSHQLPDYYTTEQGELVKAFADQAALAIVNAQRYQQAPIEAVDEERSRLARELHDSVTQALYTANLYTGAVQRALAADKYEVIDEYVQELQGTIREATHDMRLLIFELRPPLLEKEGLAAAIRARIESVEARSGIDVQLMADEQIRPPLAIEAELYRVVQEALNNIVKHAQARTVVIKLQVAQEHCLLEVSDNGRGFDPQRSGGNGHIGLATMAERVEKLGGTMTIDTTAGEGTTIRVNVPVKEAK